MPHCSRNADITWVRLRGCTNRAAVAGAPLAVAKILKAIAQEESPGLILLGKQAIDNDSNQTGQDAGGAGRLVAGHASICKGMKGMVYRINNLLDPCHLMSAVEKLKEGSAPLYAQIASLMKRRIQTGEWPPGMMLPTLNDLTAQFGVARVTVRQAMDILASERLIWRRQGKGTFVTEHSREKHWMSVETDWASLVRMIEGTESHVLNAFDTIRHPRLEPTDGRSAETYHYMRRLHSYQGKPHLLIDLYLDRNVYLRAPKKFDQLPVIPVMDKLKGLKIGPAHQSLTVSTADLDTAELLQMAIGEPIVEVRRAIQDQSGTVIYFAKLHYKADVFRLEMNLRAQ